MKIGITGATGQLGRLVVEKMKQRVNSDNLVALVRSPEKAFDLGIDASPFDYGNPEAILQGLNGIDNLLLISGSEIGQRKIQHKNIIGAAQKAGVKWIVYTSLLHADTSSLSLAKEHIETEKNIKRFRYPIYHSKKRMVYRKLYGIYFRSFTSRRTYRQCRRWKNIFSRQRRFCRSSGCGIDQ
jgi:NAD(P)H dehydrogenase (quinone)